MSKSFITSLLLVCLWNLCGGAVVTRTTLPPGCLHTDGKMYPPGAKISTNPCSPCFCPESGGHTICAIVDCMMPSCVNPVRDPSQCCSTCPDGRNCYMGNKIIPAGKDVMDGDKTCRCPDVHFGFGFGSSHQQAVCVSP